MNDPIDRQAAIDALDEIESEVADGYGYQYEKWRKYFCELPSAQPDIDEWCHDCKEYDKERHCCPRWNRVIRQTLKDAQPEIIHCGECKYYDDSDGCFFSTATTGADGFCHWAERKEGEIDGY